MNYEVFFTWIEKVVNTMASIGGWLTTPLDYINIAPLWIITGTGLVTIIAVAVVKWVVA